MEEEKKVPHRNEHSYSYMLLPKFDTGRSTSTPPHRTTQNNFYEKKRTLREVIFREKSSFARSHLSQEEAFARKYFSEKNA